MVARSIVERIVVYCSTRLCTLSAFAMAKNTKNHLELGIEHEPINPPAPLQEVVLYDETTRIATPANQATYHKQAQAQYAVGLRHDCYLSAATFHRDPLS